MKLKHPNSMYSNPKVVGFIDSMLWMAELDNDKAMLKIADRLHDIYAYIEESNIGGQALFAKPAIKQAIDVLANEVGRRIATGEIDEGEIDFGE